MQNNGALDAIHNGINLEIEKQKNSQENTMNLWKMNKAATGSDIEANLLTRSQLATVAKYQIDKAGAQAHGPIAKANAMIASGKIAQTIGATNQALGALQSNSPHDFPGPADKLGTLQRLGLVNPDQAKEIGASIDNATNLKSAYPGIIDGFFQAAQDTRPTTGGFGTSPRTFLPAGHGGVTPGTQALISRVIPTAKDVTGSVKQAEVDNIQNNIAPQFGNPDQTVYGTKLNSLIDYMANKSSAALAKSKGIDLTRWPQTNVTREELTNYVRQKYPGYVKYLNAGLPPGEQPAASIPAQAQFEYKRTASGQPYKVQVNAPSAVAQQ